jgi:hypothetical protein
VAFAVAIIWPCRVSAQEYAAAGRNVEVPRASCGDCQRPLIFWAGYPRYLRVSGVVLRIWVRRGRCTGCRCSHALLPNFVLQRRLDPASTIGTALARAVAGAGQRTVAAELGVPHTTTREWRRRHRARAPMLSAGFAALVVAFGGVAAALKGGPERTALEALAAAWWQAHRRFGAGVGDSWQFAAAVTGGNWLSTNTTPPWAGVAAADFIPPTPKTE